MKVFEIVISVVLSSLIALLSTILFCFKSEKKAQVDLQKVDGSRKPYKKPVYSLVKRIGDIIISSLVLVMMSPFLFFCSFLIKLEDKGPAFFRRTCIGYKGKIIYYRIFRTLRIDSDAELARVSTLSDPRITRVGALLRKTELDYLPLFIDVFLGKLSIIGLSRMYPHTITEGHLKLFDYAKPGILGLGMTNAKRMNYTERESMDFAYVQSLSLLTDIKILLYAILNTFVGTSRHIEPQKKDEYGKLKKIIIHGDESK